MQLQCSHLTTLSINIQINFSAKKLNDTFRLIDDITAINSDGVFQELVANIYRDSLILNRENTEHTSAHVLDINISTGKGRFIVEVYDKRDDETEFQKTG